MQEGDFKSTSHGEKMDMFGVFSFGVGRAGVMRDVLNPTISSERRSEYKYGVNREGGYGLGELVWVCNVGEEEEGGESAAPSYIKY